MASALDFGSFTVPEKQELLTALKAEILRRITGRVQSGSSAGQNFAMTQMSVAEINSLINGLTEDLGLIAVETRARPDWSRSGHGYGPGPNYYGGTF